MLKACLKEKEKEPDVSFLLVSKKAFLGCPILFKGPLEKGKGRGNIGNYRGNVYFLFPNRLS